jgi:hypothetical protein
MINHLAVHESGDPDGEPMNDPQLFAAMVREWVTRREITAGLVPLRIMDTKSPTGRS